MPGEIPDWVEQTPDLVYKLIVFNEEGWGIQAILLTREEFLALKDRLAEMRGYPRNQPQAAKESGSPA